jgi:predicted RNA-binding Zn ribbon-like protein
MVSMNDASASRPAKRNKQTLGQGRTDEFPRLLGGLLCMHFVNTVEGRLSEHPYDFLTDYAALARWGFHAGALERGEADRLVDLARSRASEAGAVTSDAVRLRQALVGVFRSIARSREVRESDLAVVHEAYAAGLAHARLVARPDRFGWSWQHRPDDLRLPIWLVARSAVELLTAGELRRIKECPGTGSCGWLFYDGSKNGTRRWCSMEGCGSKVKARRHYSRRASSKI